MRDDQTILIEIPLAFNCQSPLQHQIKLVRYTKQLKALLNAPPLLCEQCSAESLKSEILDNYLWAVGELINGMYNLKNKVKQDQRKGSEASKPLEGRQA